MVSPPPRLELAHDNRSVSSLLDALKTCIRSRDIDKAKRLHAYAVECGFVVNVVVATSVVNTYVKCGSLRCAREAFDTAAKRDHVTWNVLILGYADNAQGRVALELFSVMGHDGCVPDAITFVGALKACSSLGSTAEALAKGRAIHSEAWGSGWSGDVVVGATLLDMYSKQESIHEARRVFDRMTHCDSVSWTALIMGYAASGDGHTALELFSRMVNEGCAVDSVSLAAALKACAILTLKEELKVGVLQKGMALHWLASEDTDVTVATTMVDMYAKCGSMVDSKRVFEGMSQPAVVSWNALLFGYAENGEGQMGLQVLARMQQEGFTPNDVTLIAAAKACGLVGQVDAGRLLDAQATRRGFRGYVVLDNALVDMYSKCGSLQDARRVFDGMAQPDLVSWNSLLFGYVENGEGHLALEMFHRMQQCRVEGDGRTYCAALKACSMRVAAETGKSIHAKARDQGLENEPFVSASIIDFYGKCGNMADAQQAYNTLRPKNLVALNALLTGYSRQGNAERVLELFQDMEIHDLVPDHITFYCVLTACNRAGLLNEAKECFETMKAKHGIAHNMEHYTCMVDSLGKANELEAAVRMVENMPFKPDPWIWRTVLGSSCMWKNVEIARYAFDRLVELDPKDAVGYVLMSNLYGSLGMYDEQSRVATMQNER